MGWRAKAPTSYKCSTQRPRQSREEQLVESFLKVCLVRDEEVVAGQVPVITQSLSTRMPLDRQCLALPLLCLIVHMVEASKIMVMMDL